MSVMDNSPRFWLTSGLEAMGIDLPESTIAGLLCYFGELKRWNAKINLIGPGQDKEVIENHFLDSLALLPLVAGRHSSTLLDVGSGAGFPGLVLKISCPELQVTLVEPRQKRVSFLGHICRATKSSGVNILCQRLTDDDRGFVAAHGTFSLITCRALTRMSAFLRMVEPLLDADGLVVCMKGPRAEEELAEWRGADTGVLRCVEKRKLTLPFSRAERQLVVFARK